MSMKLKGLTLLKCLSPTIRVLLTYIASCKLGTDHFEQLWFLYFLQKSLGEAPDLPGCREREKLEDSQTEGRAVTMHDTGWWVQEWKHETCRTMRLCLCVCSYKISRNYGQKSWTTVNQNSEVSEELKPAWVFSGQNNAAALLHWTEGNTPSLLVHFKICLQIFTTTKEHSQKSTKPQCYYGNNP